ncbi:MAG: pantetheine-phosphate adenylyltransferase [Treponemataceae bacterium]|nr:MAG: pantetheine-phosphate adenylyltransferase [Treponemataceae bacterium]
MTKAIFAGSFDPPTFGHLNLIERSRTIFDEIHVVIAVNRQKSTMFTPEERYSMFSRLVAHWGNVLVTLHSGLIVDYAHTQNIHVLIRGMRNIEDFAHEFDISLVNRALDSKMETVFLPTEQRFFVLKSSAIKDVASYGGDISAMVPVLVAEELKKKFEKKD